jgi:hypothetical protein
MEIHERLTAVVQLMEERKKLMGKFRQTQQMLIAERNRFVHLKGILTSEGRDVERLEGLTLISLFYTVLGTKEEAMQKERQEYLAAKLQYDECGAAIRDLEVELENLERELDAIGDPEAEYQAVLREKEDVLLQSGGLVAQQLPEISEQSFFRQGESCFGIGSCNIREGRCARVFMCSHGEFFMEGRTARYRCNTDNDAFFCSNRVIEFIDQAVHRVFQLAAVIMPES